MSNHNKADLDFFAKMQIVQELLPSGDIARLAAKHNQTVAQYLHSLVPGVPIEYLLLARSLPERIEAFLRRQMTLEESRIAFVAAFYAYKDVYGKGPDDAFHKYGIKKE